MVPSAYRRSTRFTDNFNVLPCLRQQPQSSAEKWRDQRTKTVVFSRCWLRVTWPLLSTLSVDRLASRCEIRRGGTNGANQTFLKFQRFGRQRVVGQPEIPDGFDHILKFVGFRWLGQESVGAQPIGGDNVRVLSGCRQHQDGQGGTGLSADPFENVQSHHVRQFQVQQHERWKGIFFAVCEFSGSLQVVNGLLSIAGDLNRIRHSGFLHGVLKKKNVVGIIFDLEDCFHNLMLSLVGSKNCCPRADATRSRAVRSSVRRLCARWSSRCPFPRTPRWGESARTNEKCVGGLPERCRCRCL
jgi:hypothetical protein